ncbi:phage tail sheath family protein [Arthrobacter sp. MDT3-44]
MRISDDSRAHTIIGVATSIVAFVGRADRGPTNEPVTITSFGDFERLFGGLSLNSTLGYAVRDFYLNGGSQAIIVRLHHAGFAPDQEHAGPDAATQATATATIGEDAAAAMTAARAQADSYGGMASGGGALDANDFIGPGKEQAEAGLYALSKADLFSILCLPPYLEDGNVDQSVVAAAAAYCEKRRAMLLIDPPAMWADKDAAQAGVAFLGTTSKNAALYFPRLRQPSLVRGGQLDSFVPCGAVAGVMARTDADRGVWKAPAGIAATLVGVPELDVPLTDAQTDDLNPLGINCLRATPGAGCVIWGSRTLQGDDRLASEWKYVPVRRTALFIEESLDRGTRWAAFEPNDETLWEQIRLNVGSFMYNLFRQGAFQGSTTQEAYFVRCGGDTTTQYDIDLGVVNIVVGFAPLRPSNFVVIKIQQLARQAHGEQAAAVPGNRVEEARQQGPGARHWLL